MKIATWNINSVRLRLPHLARLVAEEQPDIICLQETKVMNPLFPEKAIRQLGYPHQHFNGMKAYNGVAILSRLPLRDKTCLNWAGREDCRHISVQLEDGTRLHNFYVPAGGDIPDPSLNDKFAHKLRFLDEMAAWLQQQKEGRVILVGDLNVAPGEHDVWSHRQLLDIVSHTPIEVEKLTAAQNSLNFIDAIREFIPPQEKCYSWWSYRAQDWEKSDRGRRLDHIWLTPNLRHRLRAAKILKPSRGWAGKPSDHVPVIIELDP